MAILDIYTAYRMGQSGIGTYAYLGVIGNEKCAHSGALLDASSNALAIVTIIKAIKKIEGNFLRVNLYISNPKIHNILFGGWLDSWAANNWHASSIVNVENKEIWKELHALIQSHKGTKFFFYKIDPLVYNIYMNEVYTKASVALQIIEGDEMSNVINLFAKRVTEATDGTLADSSFEAVQAKNAANAKRQKEERDKENRMVKRDYNLKSDTKNMRSGQNTKKED